MAKNVADVLEGRASTLYEKIGSNLAVSNVLMALLGRLVIMAQQNGKPIEGISLDTPIFFGRSIRARIKFNTLSMTRSPLGLWAPADDLVKYTQSRSMHLAKVLERNNGVKVFFAKFCEEIDQFCKHKQIKWSDLKIEKALITPDNLMVVTFSKEHVSLWER
jgi:hypothetical protein